MSPPPGRVPADELLRAGRLSNEQVRALAAWLAESQRGLPRARSPQPLELGAGARSSRLERIAAAWPALASAELAELERAQRAFLERHGSRLSQRAERGRVLVARRASPRLAELGISDGPAVARVVGPAPAAGAAPAPRDACRDAASLALDLAVGLRGDLAERLLSSYAAEADDFDLYGVVDFHERECALERVAERAEGDAPAGPGDEVRAVLLAALATGRRPLVPPSVVSVGGQVASGKSTAARALAERLGAPRIEADRTREHLVGGEPLAGFEPGQGDAVYAELLRRARVVLESGRPVVLDACFPRAAQRAAVRDLARGRGWRFLFVECRVPPEVARERLAARDAESARGGWSRLHRNVAEEWEADDDLAPDDRLVLAGDAPVAEQRRRLEARIPTWPEGLPG